MFFPTTFATISNVLLNVIFLFLYLHILVFYARLPVWRASNVQRLIDVIRNGISIQADVLKGAKAVIDGNLVSRITLQLKPMSKI